VIAAAAIMGTQLLQGRSRLLWCRGMIGTVLFVAFASSISVIAGSESTKAPAAKVVLALQGGGFRAHCTDTGLIAGLLKFVGDQKKLLNPTLSGTRLLNRFDTFSTNSGSSWFFSELAYSSTFRSLVEGMAASPPTAGDQFNKEWFTPFKSATHVTPSVFDPKRSVAEWLVTEIFGKGDEDTLFALQFVLSTNGTWNEFVQTIFESTASIQNNMTLSSPVGSFAEGKYWLIDHTILLPSHKQKAFMFTKRLNFSTYDFFQTATYFVDSSGDVPLLIPAKFSMRLGDGPNCSAPFPHVASKGLPALASFNYTGTVLPIIDKPQASYGPVDTLDFADSALVKNTGSLPLWGVCAASSAFAGAAPVYGRPIEELLAHFDNADLTPWVSNAPNGASFSHGNALVKQLEKPFGVSRRSIDDLAASAVHGVVDGGYSDGTGLGVAVASGAEEVLLVLNSASNCDAFYLEILCKDGPPPADFLQPKVL
jgi:hypothetical protein